MPTNRTRRTRSWSPDLDDYRWVSLLEGPERVLLAGKGYSALIEAGASDLDRAAAMQAAGEDWSEHGPKLLSWWIGQADDPTIRRPWCFAVPGGPGTRPWAWRQFEAPEPLPPGESEADYLTRLGLLLPGEAGHLP